MTDEQMEFLLALIGSLVTALDRQADELASIDSTLTQMLELDRRAQIVARQW